MEFRILGPLEVVDDGRPVALDRRLSRALLAYLLLHANEPVSSERLVDELWGEKPPKTAVASLQNYVSRLRRSIGPGRLRLEAAGYVLRVDPERFDLARFDRLVAEAQTASTNDRAQLLRAAIALWRGEPLEDLAFEEFAQREIAHLTERLLTAVESRIDADLELGGGAELVEELEGLVAAHPLRERMRGQLMVALYRAGRQADALAAYRDARQTLQDELGLDPSDELRALERRILEHDPALVTASAGPGAVESRRTVTALCCSVVDSTRLATTRDPEAYRRLMSSFYDAATGAIEAHGGSVETFIGDAVMAFFGIPELHEDDALRAVRAALDVRDASRRIACEEPLRVRIGVDTGEVVTSSQRDQPTATGAALNVAAQLENHAAADEIVLSAKTHGLVRDAVRAAPFDLESGLQVYRLEELIRNGSNGRRLDIPLVGRTRELRRLRAAYESAKKEQSCGVVTVVGEAGIGKTRLAREFATFARQEARVLVGRCVSYGAGATYLPLAEVVRQVVPEPSVAAIASLLAGVEQAEQVAQRVAEVIGVADGPAAPGESFWAIRKLFEALARKQPLVVAFDDLHWGESTLLDLVEYLGDWAEAPILILCLARAELLESRPAWGGPTSTGFLVQLEPLAESEIEGLLQELAGGPVAPEVQQRVVERAGGNPLFAEQLLALAAEAPDVSFDETPATVEALIGNRLDRLEQRELDVLRRASVIGRLFSRVDLEELGPVDEAALRSVERRALIHALDADARFRFHHVLVRDVAYRGIAKADRAALHERFADGLDRRGGADEIIGYHFEQAHALSVAIAHDDRYIQRLAAAAGNRLGNAGSRAWRRRGDVAATINLLERATTLMAADDPRRSELLCTLATATWLAEGDWAAAQYRAAIDAACDRRSELYARIDYAYFNVFNDPDRSVEELLNLTAEAIPLFEQLPDNMYAARAWLHRAAVQGAILGRYGASLEAAEAAIEHVRRAGQQSASAVTSNAVALMFGPTPAREGIRRCEALLRDATGGGEAGLLLFSAALYAMQGEFEEARSRVQTGADRFTELGWTMRATTDVAPVIAEIDLLAGEPLRAAETLRASCERLNGTGRAHDKWHLSTQSAQLAYLLSDYGSIDESERWLGVAERCAARVDVSAQTWRRIAAARITAARGDADRAEALARAAARQSARTDAVNDRAVAKITLSKVTRDRREAIDLIREAVMLYEQKENVVAARRTRALLSELPVG
jgi:DNA-binding SARP family transcriptional activator